MTKEKEFEYEKEFDNFYATGFQHLEIEKNDLYLNHYPFSVKIELPKGGRWLVGGKLNVWFR